MSEIPDYTPSVLKAPDTQALEAEKVHETTRAELRDLKVDVEKTLEVKRIAREKAYKESLRSYGFNPDNVQLEVGVTGASMTLPTNNAGDFKIGTADGYAWSLEGAAYRPSSYSPTAWFDSNGVGTLEEVLEDLKVIDTGFLEALHPGDSKTGYGLSLKDTMVKENPFQMRWDENLEIRLIDYEGTSTSYSRHYGVTNCTTPVGWMNLSDEKEQKKLIDNLNARYSKLS